MAGFRRAAACRHGPIAGFEREAGASSRTPKRFAHAALHHSTLKSIPEQFLEFAPQGLRDTTRIASSDALMWRDIALSNQKNVLKSLDETVKVLSTIRKAIVSSDGHALEEVFKAAKTKREGIENHNGKA